MGALERSNDYSKLLIGVINEINFLPPYWKGVDNLVCWHDQGYTDLTVTVTGQFNQPT